ncbi:hypothetical protein CMV_002147 [Castanea mollissima]|uniref:Serpin domain-containing protein n=1 Tax=Castanea mollissima TaxID=60419 RepID=A0A8J4RV19_9ROSI|nr:hypothetical protein CMV_002147 [Castanea mollissima]
MTFFSKAVEFLLRAFNSIVSFTSEIRLRACPPCLTHTPSSTMEIGESISNQTDGPTLDQFLSFLKSKSVHHINSFASQYVAVVFADASPFGGPRLSFAHGVWLDKSLSLKPSFKRVVDTNYKAALKQVDFQTKAAEVTSTVNLWAEKETSGLIKVVLPSGSVDSTTRLIFANALYFKGAWDEKFDASATEESDFHLLNGSSVQVPFMTSKRSRLLVPLMVSKSLNFLINKVKVGEFRIPKFKISFGFEASKLLKELGLVLPFSGEADLTEMVDSLLGQNLYVSSIFHKSFIEVNEEGTEAAAASAAVIVLASLPPPKMDFVADHPFLFLIREDLTGTVLLIGHVLNPLAI